MKLWQKVISGIGLGVLLGVTCGESITVIKPLGDLFIRLIKMIIAPLIFFAIVGGITSAQDKQALGRLGVKALLTFFITTLFAIAIGFSTAWFFQPGHGVILDLHKTTPIESTSVAQILNSFINIIPENAIAAMSQGHVLQVVFFAIFTGLTIQTLPDKTRARMTDFMHLFQALVFRMVHIIVKLAPLAACTFIAWIVGTQGMDTLKGLLKFYGCIIFACTIQYFIFGIMISVFARVSPLPFFKKCLGYQSIAFATTSSKAALGTAIRIAQEKLGISKTASSFLIPMGATLNMDGFAIYLGMSGVFIAQALGKTMGLYDYGILMLMSTLGTIGGAGIPGGALVVLPMILSALGLPLEAVAIIAGIDRLIDPFTTTINITGDVAVTLCVDASEKTFNKEIYHAA